MRYRELNEARPWRKYQGRSRPCLLSNPHPVGIADGLVIQAEGHWGLVVTGRTETFWGYFVRVVGPSGEEWLGEDRSSVRAALGQAADAIAASGWSLLAIGLDDDWQETGLSYNSGWGVHRSYDRHANMLEPPSRTPPTD